MAAYNGNIWFWRLWRRSQILYVILMVSFFMMLLIQFSFTGIFEDNVYLLLIILKVVQMIVEYALEQYFGDNLIISPISCTIASMIVIATMGSSDFYDFLFSYFIELCIQMLERAYIIKIQQELTNYLERQYQKLVITLKKLFNEDNENEQQNVEEEKIEETEQKADYYNNNDSTPFHLIP